MSTLAARLAKLNRESRFEESAVLAAENEAEVWLNSVAAFDAGWALFQLERFEDALRFFERADELQPSKPQNSWARGLTLRELGRVDEAETHLVRSVGCKSTYLNRMALALIYLETGHLEAAERCHLVGLAERRTRERLESYADFLGDTGRTDEETAILKEAADAPIESASARELAYH